MRLKLAMAAAALTVTIAAVAPASAQAQSEEAKPIDWAGKWTWAEFDAIAGVSDEQRKLLHSVPEAEAREALRLSAAMGTPESSQVVSSLMTLDGAALLPERFGPFARIARDLMKRPPADDAGIIRNAALAVEFREAMIAFRRPFFRSEFAGKPWPGGLKQRLEPSSWSFALNFAPAKTILGLLDKPVSVESAHAALTGKAFDALWDHRSQSFYTSPMTRDRYALAISIASSRSPALDFYRFLNPVGLLDLNDVTANRGRYEAVIETLAANEQSIAAEVQAKIGPFIPPGTKFDRTVYLLFADGADGWAANGIAGLDLEYFKDDYGRLLSTLSHETYHVAQDAAYEKRFAPKDEQEASAASLFRQGIESIFAEGSASYIAPPKQLSVADRNEMVTKGIALFDKLASATTADEAQQLVNDGTKSAGPFYWLGAEMSRVIVDAGGRAALAATLRSGGPCFFDAYFKALKKRPKEKPLFSADVAARVRAIQ